MNKNWKFFLGDAKNAHTLEYNDRTWKNVDLPHDWVISQAFKYVSSNEWTAQNMQGFFDWENICWYRKKITLENIKEKIIYLYFGCAYRNSQIFINGKKIGGRANGYISFEIDITDFVKEGENLIAVKLDNGCEAPDRWYSGSGLFRNVCLKIVQKTHIKRWGVYVKSELNDKNNIAFISINTEIINKDNLNKIKIKSSVIGKDEEYIAQIINEFDLKNQTLPEQHIQINNPNLWSAEKPCLYKFLVQLESNGKIIDEQEIIFGIRKIEIAYNKGMTVNGEKIKLKGVCLHHDCGIAGASHYDEVWKRRLLILKSIGCNAIRTSHNPPSEEFLNLCDEIGFYVIDECFDKWKSGYYENHFDDDAQRDLTDFILRDRNHPCIFMWSVGNEVENQGQDSMIEIQKMLVNIVRKLDSRQVTCALSPHANPRSLVWAPVNELVELTKKITQDVDVIGLNYHEPLYRSYTDEIQKPIIGTECYEYYSSVGTNFEDVCDKNPWQFVLENENVIGQFIWAGIDYLGEAPYPSKGWTGSIIDICGFLKPNAYFRKSIWSDEPFVYIAFNDQSKKNDYTRGRWSFPPMTSHLNHENFNRCNVSAVTFTNCEEAELWINGKKRGRRKREDFNNGIIQWYFEYTYGSIEVKGINKNKEVCSYILKTAETPEKIKLIPDKTILKSGEVAHIEINITDKNDILCQTKDFLIELTLTGDAVFLGACSSDLTQDNGFTIPKVVTNDGKALAMIKAGESGNIELCASCSEVSGAKLSFKIK
ncbi:MAG: DUF4982 domain-containing protein [Treponema sp.]|nr:DUF4982 domain-containing protein [Treponema sp.]